MALLLFHKYQKNIVGLYPYLDLLCKQINIILTIKLNLS